MRNCEFRFRDTGKHQLTESIINDYKSSFRTHMKPFVILILSIVIISVSFSGVSARNGTISGIILDKENKESIIGAYVKIDDTHFVTATDIDGRYILRNVPPGVYTLTFTYIGYKAVSMNDVVVNDNERISIDLVMERGTQELDDITVVSYRVTSTIESVLVEVQNLSQVVSGVSAQQISRSQDNNAAQVMQRIPGITISENRFVIIRGLSERYNNVMINNVMAPSTEVDKRTFSFDLISSGALDRLLVFKSGSPDLPGDFAGGVIKLFTVDEVASNYLRVSIGGGYRFGTTGRQYMQSDGSGTDFLGFDNGFRRLPSGFPDSRTLQSSPRNDQLRIDAAHSLANNFLPVETTAQADHSIGFTIGRNANFGKRSLSSITTVGHSTSFKSFDRNFFRYFEWVDQNRPIIKRFDYVDSNFHKENKVNVMSNWKL
ncbi:MAG: TonB-dependent receptor, partial [Balneolaceae bacterium]